MIVLPSAVGLGLALCLAIFAIGCMGREAQNLAHVAEDDYERRGTNWSALLIAVIVGAALLGALGVGPFAGIVAIETLR